MKPADDRTTIFTLRHARTDYGEQRRYAGSVDVPLSERGVSECLAAAEALGDSTFDVIVTSTLRRAVDTARLIAAEAPVRVQSKLCNERCFGIMEGLTPEEVRTLQPPVLFIEVGDDLHSVNPEGGESFEDVWERAKKFVRWVLREHGGSTVLVVSHGVFLQMCHGVLRGSNCIESLGTYPGTLELRRFDLAGRRLVSEETIRLLSASGLSF